MSFIPVFYRSAYGAVVFLVMKREQELTMKTCPTLKKTKFDRTTKVKLLPCRQRQFENCTTSPLARIPRTAVTTKAAKPKTRDYSKTASLPAVVRNQRRKRNQ